MKKLTISLLLSTALGASLLPLQSAYSAATADNAALVTDYLHALFVDKDLDEVQKYWGAQMIQHNPTLPDGHAVLRQIIGKLGPDFKYEQGLTMKQGNYVMVHGRYTGWGPKPLVGVDIFRIDAGKVIEHWDVLQEEVPADKSPNGHAMFPAG